ncbi:cysteinyl leukotriene receptor 1 [Manacus vitellinus]|uniref:cysteinyl leukotriene receptor 1 n=1 Tax=Manacus vitellinus TaxID=328815 RepID=UPI0008468213|nr:cysteinyl leukotriene receptor 1 [Manacus vitellinus]XP_051643926.1 cysteinyl leukotriene receptor 1 [Manacus candei]
MALFDNLSCHHSIDDFRNRVYSSLYSMISIMGFVGNGVVLYVLIRTYRQKTAFQVYLLNLALSDFLCVSTLPLRVVYYVHRGHWFFGDLLCRVASYALYVNLYCSIFFMTAMSFFRCIAIVFPVRNINLVTERKAKFVSVGIWIFVTLTSAPFLRNGTYQHGNKTKCFEPPENSHKTNLVVILDFIALFVGFILPFVVITICYAMIIRTLLRNSMRKNQANRRRAVWMIAIVTATFLVSFTPYHVLRTVHLHVLRLRRASCEDAIYLQKAVVVTLPLAAANCCFDPLLYFFSGGNFRKRLTTLRKGSSSSLSQAFKKKFSAKERDEEPFGESQRENGKEAVASS